MTPSPTLALLSLSLALCACSKKEPAQTASPPAKPSVSVDALMKSNPGDQLAEPPPPAPTAPAPALDTPAPASAEAAPEPGGPEATAAAVAAYNEALSRWIGMHEDAPVDLNALRRVKGLPPLPTPPPGKQIIYVINPKSPIMSHIAVR